MSIEDVSKRGIQEKPLVKEAGVSSVKRSADTQAVRKGLGDPVKTSVKPELETAEAAKALSQSLADRLSEEEGQALNAIGSIPRQGRGAWDGRCAG